MSSALENFRKGFINVNGWELCKDGPPLYLIDALHPEEKTFAEQDLIRSLNVNDLWAVTGLGHMRSTNALPYLQKLYSQATSYGKITIAHAIFRISSDPKMIELILDEFSQITNESHLIHIIYMLRTFNDLRINNILHELRKSDQYLIAYNATRALHLDTDAVVEKFRQKKIQTNRQRKNTS